jgi:hypothetical protein
MQPGARDSLVKVPMARPTRLSGHLGASTDLR